MMLSARLWPPPIKAGPVALNAAFGSSYTVTAPRTDAPSAGKDPTSYGPVQFGRTLHACRASL